MKTYQQFLEEAWNRKSQQASKQGNQPKLGSKSGKSELTSDVKMVGAPGSGKSTMATRLAKSTKGTRYGFDDARKDLYGHRSEQGNIQDVKDKTYDTLAKAPNTGPKIQDNTNVNKRFAKQTDQELKTRAGFGKTVSVAPRTPRRAAFRRNSKRDVPVPQKVMNIMHNQERDFKRSKEGEEAVRTGRQLTKRYRLNRRSVRARLGVENPKRGKE
jgi:predicted kinase